jgi:hypothetical protein
MKQILENLKQAVVLPAIAIEELQRHLTNNYPQISAADRDRVLQQYLEKQLESQLNLFDAQYRPYIRRQLYRYILDLDKHPGKVCGLDILAACLQLNFEIDQFYLELKKWILSYPVNRGLEGEVSGLIALLRQVSKSYPEMTLDDLITAEQLFTDAATQLINESASSDVSWGEKDVGNLVPIEQIYFNNQWNTAEEEKREFQKKIGFKTLAAAGLGLILLASLSFLMASSNNPARVKQKIRQPAQIVQVAPPTEITQPEQSTPKIVAVAPTIEPTPISSVKIAKAVTKEITEDVPKNVKRSIAKDIKLDNRIKRSSIVSRSHKRETVAVIPVRSPTQPAPQTVVVGYTVAYNGLTTTKIPLVKTFSNKLKLKAKVSNGKDNGETDVATTSPGITIKGKTVAVDPRVISAGSRVYIKHPPEYRNLDGVYITETNETGGTMNPTPGALESQSTSDAATENSNDVAVAEHEVEVYVLDEQE